MSRYTVRDATYAEYTYWYLMFQPYMYILSMYTVRYGTYVRTLGIGIHWYTYVQYLSVWSTARTYSTQLYVHTQLYILQFRPCIIIYLLLITRRTHCTVYSTPYVRAFSLSNPFSQDPPRALHVCTLLFPPSGKQWKNEMEILLNFRISKKRGENRFSFFGY